MNRFVFLVFLLFVKIYLLTGVCPPGAIDGTDPKICYKFYGSNVYTTDFYTAEENCASINGHLASVSDAFINANLANTLKQILQNPQTPVWLGGTRVNNTWTWTDGKPFTFTNWEKGEPKDGNNCLYINPPDGKWISTNCSKFEPYLCEISSNIDSKPTQGTSPKSTCPTQRPIELACDPGWTYSNISNACYKMIHNYKWTEAENECVTEGAHLASIHSLMENDFIANFAKTGMETDTFTSTVWIGLNDLGGIGLWKWTDGTNFDYQNWAPTQPKNLNTAFCVYLTTDLIKKHHDYFQHWGTWNLNQVTRAAICQKHSRLLQ